MKEKSNRLPFSSSVKWLISLSLKIVFIFAISADPDEMPHYNMCASLFAKVPVWSYPE